MNANYLIRPFIRETASRQYKRVTQSLAARDKSEKDAFPPARQRQRVSLNARKNVPFVEKQTDERKRRRE